MSNEAPALRRGYHPGTHRPSMTAPISTSAHSAIASLTTFLGHVERRAAVLAELACGDPARGDAAVAAAMRALRSAVARSGGRADADPALRGQFWGLLLAAPQLRRPGPKGRWPADLAILGALERGTRAALLLRLVAGLDDTQAARALRVTPETFRRAVGHAYAQPADMSRAAFWDGVARAIEHHVQQLPSDRLARLAAARDRALAGVEAPARDPVAAPRWQRAALATAIGACALALTATFLPGPAGDDARIAVSALPAAEAPASTYDGDSALLTHPDFEQLADTPNDALAQELDFYAWYAARLAAADEATPVLMPDAGHALPATPVESPHATR